MEFVPLWTDILEGPCWKIMDLPAEVYRFWTFCLMAAQRYDFADGHLPDDRTLSHWCQMDRDTCVTLRDRLVTCGLIDRDTGRDMPEYRIHDWDQWRLVKDTGAKERKRRQRQRSKGLAEESRNGHGSVTVESQDVTPQHSAFSIQHSADRECGGTVTGAVTPAPAPTPSELDSGRTGDEHTLFCQVIQELESFEETKYLGGQLVMYAETPGVRNYESWRLLVACRVVQRPDKPKSWSTFTKSADNATWDEYQRLTRKHAPGASAAEPKKYNVVAGP